MQTNKFQRSGYSLRGAPLPRISERSNHVVFRLTEECRLMYKCEKGILDN